MLSLGPQEPSGCREAKPKSPNHRADEAGRSGGGGCQDRNQPRKARTTFWGSTDEILILTRVQMLRWVESPPLRGVRPSPDDGVCRIAGQRVRACPNLCGAASRDDGRCAQSLHLKGASECETDSIGISDMMLRGTYVEPNRAHTDSNGGWRVGDSSSLRPVWRR